MNYIKCSTIRLTCRTKTLKMVRTCKKKDWNGLLKFCVEIIHEIGNTLLFYKYYTEDIEGNIIF
jgi:hypothetical protein